MTRFTHAVIFFSLGLWLMTSAGTSSTAREPEAAKGQNPEDQLISQALIRLDGSKTGQELIQKAMQAWNLKSRESLREHFRWGDASRTDAVLIRHYDSETGQETRERKVTIYLRRGQPLEDMMLDLAHELVHATSRPGWDPYDPKLSAAEYIRVAIEGAGGEVEAVQAECRVSLEVFGEKSKSLVSRCQRYGTSLAAQTIRKDFYRVGRWDSELTSRLGDGRKLLPLLSNEKPSLYSSTGNAPYPVALLEEYRQMTSVACENSRRRAATLAEDSDENGRSPASVPASANDIEQNNRLFLTRRCQAN